MTILYRIEYRGHRDEAGGREDRKPLLRSVFKKRRLLLIMIVWLVKQSDECMRTSKALLKLRCPGDIEVVCDKRSTSALISWTREDFDVSSTHSLNGIYQTVPVYAGSTEVNRSFYEGRHYIEYKATDEAGNFDHCSFTVTVRVIRCPTIYNPEFGILSCEAGSLHGSRCKASCIPGYTAVGAETIECQDSGQWSANIPFCRLTTCPDPGTPLYSTRTCTTDSHIYGSICSYHCSTGYQLTGNNRLVCGSDGDWLASPPTCKEIILPKLEKCPTSVHMTTTGATMEVQKPEVFFRSASGVENSHSCTHFGDNQRHNFTLGLHQVSCTAFDPDVGERSVVRCDFNVKITANPCRALGQPPNGSLLCSRAHGGGSSAHDTICHVSCNKGYALARGNNWPPSSEFLCDFTGTWQPPNVVPSCVVPKRPLELKLPSELYYASHGCPSAIHLNRARVRFQSTLQSIIRKHQSCSMNPRDCIVEDVAIACLPASAAATVSRSSTMDFRFRRHLENQHHRSRRYSLNRRRRREALSLRYPFQLPIQFHFSTRVAETGGYWPDEYHRAISRLFGMFDHFEGKLATDEDTNDRILITDELSLEPVQDSLTYAPVSAICDMGFGFNEAILLCVPCGPGTYFNISKDRCVVCQPPTYQDDQAEFECKPCPAGSTTVEDGAISLAQCIDIDECLSNPCLNSGQCVNGNDRFSCTCLPGYTGKQCEHHVFDCQSHSCQYGGSCQPEGPDTYSCLCRPEYFGEYCQYYTVDGGWSDWSEWTPCSRSCDGGVQLRNRSCDSPPPSHGGLLCPDAAIEEKVCNLHTCPGCKKLRRPYQGSIVCDTKVAEQVTVCNISCQDGFTFSSMALHTYVCGKNTSYIWPHESPDNPRALLPACTEKIQPKHLTFEFRSALSIVCPSEEERSTLLQEIQHVAEEITADLECRRQGVCSLNDPHIRDCSNPDQAGIVRTKRKRGLGDVGVEQFSNQIEVSVSLSFHQGSTMSYDMKLNDQYNRTMAELRRLSAELLNQSHSGALFVVVNGSRVDLDTTRTMIVNAPLCQPGTVPSDDGLYCSPCVPGSYHPFSQKICVLCEVGSFQPTSGQTGCIKCPDDQITYGRGATRDIECYPNGTIPPDIPDKFSNYGSSPKYFEIVLGLLSSTALALVVLSLAFFLYYRRKNKRGKYCPPKMARLMLEREIWNNINHENFFHAASVLDEKT